MADITDMFLRELQKRVVRFFRAIIRCYNIRDCFEVGGNTGIAF